MSYNAAKHAVFSERMRRAMVALSDTLDREMELIDDIYTSEATSGSHADYTDTDIATEAEHTAGIVAIRALQTTYDAQRTNITPFLQ